MKNLKNLGKALNKIEQKAINGGSNGFACSFAGICFNALSESHCLDVLGLEPCNPF